MFKKASIWSLVLNMSINLMTCSGLNVLSSNDSFRDILLESFSNEELFMASIAVELISEKFVFL